MPCWGRSGNPEPELLADLDGDRVGRAIPVEVAEIRRQQNREHSVNWCGVGAPTKGWARQVLGEPDVERLWELVAFCIRLDEADPVAAWREHLDRLDARAAGTHRAQARRAPLPGAGDGLHRRPPADGALGQRPVPHRRRHRLRREHADRGDLHDAGSPARRGDAALEPAAQPRRAARSAISSSRSRTGGSSGSRPRRGRTSSAAISRTSRTRTGSASWRS